MITKKIIFSIIIPHYNLGNKIEKLLSSLQQEVDNSFEIIIIDDMSSKEVADELFSSIKKFDFLNIHYFSNDTGKKGAGVCRNIGMKFAVGKWFIFADSDDHFLAGCGKKFLEYANTDNDLIFFPPISTDEFGQIGERHKTFLKGFSDFYKLDNDLSLRYQFPVVWSKMFRASIVEKYSIRFDEVLVSNDMMFATKFGYYADKISVSNFLVYSWDFYSDSITSNISKEKFEIVKNVMITKNNFLRQNLDWHEYKKVRSSAIKPFFIALTRYRFGVIYSVSTFLKLICNGFVPIRKDEIKLDIAKRFFKNNELYKNRKK